MVSKHVKPEAPRLVSCCFRAKNQPPQILLKKQTTFWTLLNGFDPTKGLPKRKEPRRSFAAPLPEISSIPWSLGAVRQRVAVNAEGRFLAHWDEFVEHRKEAWSRCSGDRGEDLLKVVSLPFFGGDTDACINTLKQPPNSKPPTRSTSNPFKEPQTSTGGPGQAGGSLRTGKRSAGSWAGGTWG